MAGQARRGGETTEAPAQTGTDLIVEEANWPGGGGQLPHPVLVEKLRASMGERTTSPAGKWQGKPFALPVANAEDEKLRTRQLRDAGRALNIGVAIRAVEQNGARKLVFRAKERRNTGKSGE